MLSEKDIERIKAEESVRRQIRNELDNDKPKRSRIVRFLNSPLGLLIVSSVLISGVGTLISNNAAKNKELEATRIKIADDFLELQYRLVAMQKVLEGYSKLQSELEIEAPKEPFDPNDSLLLYKCYLIGQIMLGAEGWYFATDMVYQGIPTAKIISRLNLKLRMNNESDILDTAINIQILLSEYDHACESKDKVQAFLKNLEATYLKEAATYLSDTETNSPRWLRWF